MISLNEYSLCLSIDDNRYNSMCTRFHECGLKKPLKINGIKHRDHTYACNVGHARMLKYAYENNYPYCVFFEDDAYPRKDVLIKFNDIINDIKEDGFDILLLGIQGETSAIKQVGCFDPHNRKKHSYDFFLTNTSLTSNSDLTFKNCNRIHGAHAYVVKYKDYMKIYKRIISNKRVIIDLGFDIDQKNGLRLILSKQLLFTQQKIYPFYYNKEELCIGPLKIHNEYAINFN